jgi:hypothetical protein
MKLGGFVAVLLAGFAGQGATVCSGGPSLAWRKVFQVDKATLASTGRNAYFVLEPGYRLEFTHGRSTLVVTVLEETNEVDGVQSRVVEPSIQRPATCTTLGKKSIPIATARSLDTSTPGWPAWAARASACFSLVGQ